MKLKKLLLQLFSCIFCRKIRKENFDTPLTSPLGSEYSQESSEQNIGFFEDVNQKRITKVF